MESIKQDFKNSRLYAQITNHPELLRQEGYFDQNSSFGKKRKAIKHPKKFYDNLDMKMLKKHGIKKSDPKFFIKVDNLSKKMVGKSGKYVNYKGEYIPVESWCREYGVSFYDKNCKQDLKDAGITVHNNKPSFGKKRTSKIPLKIKKLCRKLKIKMTIKRGSKRVYKSLKVLKTQIKKKMK
jgi:hypothetical protein